MSPVENALSSAQSLFGRTRSAVLSRLYTSTEQSFYLRQLEREIGAGHGALQRELKHLTDLGLVQRTAQGNQVLYRANEQSPIFSEVRSLVAKTVGIREVLASSLASMKSKVKIAFVYGSVARHRERPNSDIDLMAIGSASFGEVVSALGHAQKALSREINPTVFPVSEFREKLRIGNHFLRTVMGEGKLFVIGTQNELADLVAR